MMYLILALAVIMLVAVLLPTSRKAVATVEDTQRSDLQEERDLLVSELRDLSVQSLPDTERERAELVFKARLARVLKALDELPPAPSGTALSRPAHLPALLLTLGCASLMIVGGFTFFQTWRYKGINEGEAKQLQNVLKLPALQTRASTTKNPEDIRAYARAAFDAGKFQQSAQAYADLLNQTKNTRDPEALRRMGVYLSTTEEYKQQALGLVQSAVEQDPKEAEGYLLLGYTHMNNGNGQEALDAFLKFRDLKPMSLEADEQIAELRAALGNNATGAELFAQNCAACHGPEGKGKTGPSILNSAAMNDTETLKTLIQKGAGAMPAFPSIKGEELEALVKHVQSLKP